MDQAVVGLIGAAIGAAGAVGAQAVGSVFTQRATNARFAWEKEQAEHREQAERAARFLDVKRDMFSRFLAAHSMDVIVELNNQSRRAMTAKALRGGDFAAPKTVHDIDDELDDQVHTRMREARRVAEEVSLVAPSLSTVCNELTRVWGNSAVAILARSSLPPSGGWEPFDNAYDACREAMAAHLAGASVGVAST